MPVKTKCIIVLPPMKIRFAKRKDRTQTLRLFDELGEAINELEGYSPSNTETYKFGGPVFDEILSTDYIKIILAEENSQIVATAVFHILPNIRHGTKRAHIEYFVVTKNMRNKEIGTKLMTAIKDYCRKSEIATIILGSGLKLKRAHKFYRKNGFAYREKLFRFDFNII